MIDVRELKIGNVLRDINWNIGWVTSINRNGGRPNYDIAFHPYGESMPPQPDELYPIDLNHDVLTANKFEVNKIKDNVYYWTEYEHRSGEKYKIELISEDEGYIFRVEDERGNNTLSVKLNYFHELQNFYHAITGNPLSTNDDFFREYRV